MQSLDEAVPTRNLPGYSLFSFSLAEIQFLSSLNLFDFNQDYKPSPYMYLIHPHLVKYKL